MIIARLHEELSVQMQIDSLNGSVRGKKLHGYTCIASIVMMS